VFYIAFILSYRRHVGYAPDSVRESDMPTGRFGPLSTKVRRSRNASLFNHPFDANEHSRMNSCNDGAATRSLTAKASRLDLGMHTRLLITAAALCAASLFA
jgi:hypothetical protein